MLNHPPQSPPTHAHTHTTTTATTTATLETLHWLPNETQLLNLTYNTLYVPSTLTLTSKHTDLSAPPLTLPHPDHRTFTPTPLSAENTSSSPSSLLCSSSSLRSQLSTIFSRAFLLSGQIFERPHGAPCSGPLRHSPRCDCKGCICAITWLFAISPTWV
jgi:hypothetical protein